MGELIEFGDTSRPQSGWIEGWTEFAKELNIEPALVRCPDCFVVRETNEPTLWDFSACIPVAFGKWTISYLAYAPYAHFNRGLLDGKNSSGHIARFFQANLLFAQDRKFTFSIKKVGPDWWDYILGWNQPQTADKAFNERFVLKTSQDETLAKLLANTKLAQFLTDQPSFSVSIRWSFWTPNAFPDAYVGKIYILSFFTERIIYKPDELRRIHQQIIELSNALSALGVITN